VRLETLSLMSDVEIPVYVARAQVGSAIDMVVQLDRFSTDGSRRVTRITQIHGLDEKNDYRFRDLYACRLRGKTQQGQLIGGLQPTGEKPTFAKEPYDQGMEELLRHSREMWNDGMME